jgi:glycerol-3-phosphate dehydrogenase
MMERNLAILADKEYDLVIIGGGIYGASVARDAAMRGLTVALVDKGDFGSATSANNHKIIHGGLRYLQHGDLKRMRESIRERSILMRIAPHLVRPLPFLIPTYGHLLQGKLGMAVALKLNDLISFDRNRGLDPERIIPPGRVISPGECVQLCPKLNQNGLSGGAIFFDAQVYNTDRLTLSHLLSAARDGADMANYVRVAGFVREGNTITGIRVTDVLSQGSFGVRAGVVVNCSGPWNDDVLRLLNGRRENRRIELLKAVVLVTRPLVQDIAVGVPSVAPYKDEDAIINKGDRYFFITPWRNTSLIGTYQLAYETDPDEFEVGEQDITDFIREVNAALPGADLRRQDVYFVYAGLLPRADGDGDRGSVQLLKRYEIRDHAVEDDIEGLISVVGVKYTAARQVAETTIDLVMKKLGRGHVRCLTGVTPVHGGMIEGFERFMARQLEKHAGQMSEEILRHLIQSYGAEYMEILRYCEEDPQWAESVTGDSPVIKAEVLHGVREEMARKLGDVIFRRTELGTAGYPGDACLETCAALMAAELGWDHQRTLRELEETGGVYASLGCKP